MITLSRWAFVTRTPFGTLLAPMGLATRTPMMWALMGLDSRPPMGFTLNRWAFDKAPYTRENLRGKKQNSNN